MKKYATLILTILLVNTITLFSQVALNETFSSWPPEDWTLNPANGQTGAWEFYSSDYAKCNSASPAELISPQLDLTQFENVALLFKYRILSNYNIGYLNIYGSVDGIEFNLLDSLFKDATNFSTDTILLSNSIQFIKFKALTTGISYNQIHLDDIRIVNITPYTFSNFPSPDLMYDFNMDNQFDMIVNNYTSSNIYYGVVLNKTFLNGYKDIEPTSIKSQTITGIFNVNNDTMPELYTNNYIYEANGTSYDIINTKYRLWDQNLDGRPDLAMIKDADNWLLMQQKPDGSFTYITPEIISYEDYNTSTDYSYWNEGTVSYGQGMVVNRPPGMPGMISCVASVINVSPSSNEIDLNKDGLPDLLESSDGLVLYNLGNGKYVSSTFDGKVTAKDLNNDFISDFIVYNEATKKVQVLIYRGNNKFDSTTLMESLALDPEIYCCDLDQDNDIDILLPFSYSGNNTGTFMAICENDGNGNFTIHENGYVGKNWEFKICKDIDNDGFYDLIMYDRTNDAVSGIRPHSFMLKGKAGFEFDILEDILATSTVDFAEDINKDGFYDIWTNNCFGYEVYHVKNGVANTAPALMDKPIVSYIANNNSLEVSWKTGTDNETSSCDLTYALRIGSAPGKNDMFFAHANADGTRRNFKSGNMGSDLSKVFNVESWPAGNYYISTQTIDAQHKGSAWSEETVFEKKEISAVFTTSVKDSVNLQNSFYKQITEAFTSDLIYIDYSGKTDTSNYTYSWDFDKAVVVEKTSDGSYQINWETPGTKNISLKITDHQGNSVSFEKELIINPSKFITKNYSCNNGNSTIITHSDPIINFVDYNEDGKMDVVLSKFGLYNNTGNASFEKLGKIFNLAFAPTRGKWFDYDLDGDLDYINETSATTSGYANLLQNNGNTNFVLTNNALNPTVYFNQSSRDKIIDINNDGYYDYGSYYINKGDYSFEAITGNSSSNYIDWNKDGWIDSWRSNLDNVYGLYIIENKGTVPFSTKKIELPISLNNKTPIVAIEDFDNDNDWDVLVQKNEKVYVLVLNNGDNTFTKSIDIEINNKNVVTTTIVKLLDLDNNGYKDIIQISNDSQIPGLVIMCSANNTFNQVEFDYSYPYGYGEFIDVDGDSVPDIANPINYFKNLCKSKNTQPAAPLNVMAIQTDTTLLISWEDAKDKETPLCQMRYNLSVKKKGVSGAGAFIISPENSLNNAAVILPGKNYLQSTRFEVPISRLTPGEYEIQVQSIDLWNYCSNFSPAYTVKVEAAPVFEIPAETCFDQSVTINYKGNAGTSISWDFDEGQIISGTGVGPYVVKWASAGVKNIVVTVDDINYTSSIKVLAQQNATFIIPETLVKGIPETVLIQQKITAGTTLSWDNDNALISWTRGDSIAQITFNKSGEQNIGLTVSNNLCSSEKYTLTVQVLEELPVPELEIVTIDAESGKNILIWDNATWPDYITKVLIYKEGSVYNKFDTIAIVDKSVMSYIDMESKPDVQSERYYLALMDKFGHIGSHGNIHQTIHLTINKGLSSSWNLIWNSYSGEAIDTYRVLRGSSSSNMSLIAELSGAMKSFTDMNPVEGESIYQLEFVPTSVVANSPANNLSAEGRKALNAAKNNVIIGSSNKVNTSNASSFILTEKLKIMALEKVWELNSEQTAMHLFTERYPANTTYSGMNWEITEGKELATISSSGLLVANKKGVGTIKVKANAVDGSGVSDSVLVSVNFPANSVNVTFHVDMQNKEVSSTGVYLNGSFCGWTPANAVQLTANGSVYSGTVELTVGETIEYKFVNGAADEWAKYEVITGSTCAVGNDANRGFVVPNENMTLDLVCFESCSSCVPIVVSDSVDVTFRVDMQNELVSASGVYLNGSFCRWTPADAVQLTTSGTVYSTTLKLKKGETIEYKFVNEAADQWWKYEIIVGQECAFGNDANRAFVVPNENTILDLVCFNSCEVCPPSGIIDETLFKTIEIFPNPVKNKIIISGLPEMKSKISLIKIDGVIIQQDSNDFNPSFEMDLTNYVRGIYIICIENEFNKRYFKIIKE